MRSNALSCVGAIVITSVLSLPPVLHAQSLRLYIRVDSVVAQVGQTGALLPVYMDNIEDTVGAFSFWIRLSRPGLCSLRTTIATAGTLTESWHSVIGNTIIPGNDVRVIGVAESGGSGDVLAPQSGGVPLFNLQFDVKNPSAPYDGDDVVVELVASLAAFFNVSDPHGTSIGIRQDTVPDTNLFRCTAWDGDDCLAWQQVSLPPYDSMEIVDVVVSVLDTSAVHVVHGNIDVDELPCGDITGDDMVDLSDLIALVSYLFQGGEPPHSMWAANVNGSIDHVVDLSDLTYMVNGLFLGGPQPQCP